MFKSILIILAVIFGLFVVTMISMVLVVSSANRPKGNKEEVLTGKDTARKALIVYQPGFSNITAQVAHQIAKGLNESGYTVTLNYPGSHLPGDITQYPVVIFGSPVYAGQVSKALTDYMAKVRVDAASRVVVFSTGSVMNEVKELDVLEKSLPGVTVYKKVKFSTAGNNDSQKQAYDLGKELAGK